jgi:hypothetical protein
MRIAQIAPLTEAVPPQLYGGTERYRANTAKLGAAVRMGERAGILKPQRWRSTSMTGSASGCCCGSACS